MVLADNKHLIGLNPLLISQLSLAGCRSAIRGLMTVIPLCVTLRRGSGFLGSCRSDKKDCDQLPRLTVGGDVGKSALPIRQHSQLLSG